MAPASEAEADDDAMQVPFHLGGQLLTTTFSATPAAVAKAHGRGKKTPATALAPPPGLREPTNTPAGTHLCIDSFCST
jgi:hypothetical protein